MKSSTALYFSVSGNTLIYQQLRQRETELGTATEVCICAAQTMCLRQWLLLTTAVSVVLLSILQLHQHLQPSLLLVIIVLQICMLLYRCHHKVVSERLLLVGGLGAQVTTSFISGRICVRFVPWASLADVIIAETISMQRVLHYAALLVWADSGHLHLRLLPLFLTWWPRLACLRQVYRSCQCVLAGPREVPRIPPSSGVLSHSSSAQIAPAGVSPPLSGTSNIRSNKYLRSLSNKLDCGAPHLCRNDTRGGLEHSCDVAFTVNSTSESESRTRPSTIDPENINSRDPMKRKNELVDCASVLKRRRVVDR